MPKFSEAAPSGPPIPYRDDHEPARLKAAVRTADVIHGATGVAFDHKGDAPCPWCQKATDRERKFRVLSRGGYKCVKCGRSGGDVFAFLQEWHGWDFAEAKAELRRIVGGEAPAIDRAKLEAEITRSKAKAAADKIRKQANARALWERAGPLTAEAVAYLRDQRKLPNHADLPLRFLADCPHGEGGERTDCIIASATDAATGNVVGIHRIALEMPPDGKRRKMLGAIQGHAVRLTASGGKPDTLVLAEGIETAAAVAWMWGFETWACLSADFLSGQAIPAHVRRLIIVADHDLPNEEGKGPYTDKGGTGWALARKAAASYAARGVAVEIRTTPEPDTDANDVLLGEAGDLYLLETHAPAAPVPEEAPAAPAEAVAEPADADVESFLEPAPGPAAPIALPDFDIQATDHAVALAAAEREVAERMTAAVVRVELHALCRAAEREARDKAREEYARYVGKALEEMTPGERVQCGREGGHARREARAGFLADRGLEALPDPESRLFTGSTGVGKTRAVARALATMRAGIVVVAAPTLAKADEFGADLRAALVEAYRGSPYASRVEVVVWRGRTKEKQGEPEGGTRMCGRDAETVKEVQGTGASVLKAMCGPCPLRDECAYLAQRRKVQGGKGGALVVVISHEGLFLPLPVSPDLLVVDEDAALRAARIAIIPPEQVASPAMWEGAEPFVAYDGDLLAEGPGIALATVAARTAEALAHTGRELAELRGRGITAPMLDACSGYLFHRHRELTRAIEDAGADDKELRRLVRELHAHAYRPIGTLFVRLAEEIEHPRDATNGTRRELLPVEETEADGGKAKILRQRFVVRSLRTPRIRKDAELVVLDATGDARLVGAAFRPVEESRGHVPLLGKVWQTSTRTNSRARLLKSAGHEKKLKTLAKQIENTAKIVDGSLFACTTKEIRKDLEPLVERADATWLHYGSERGMNTATECRAGIIIGRQEVSPGGLESTARCFAAADAEPFVSIMPADATDDDESDERTWLVPATRTRLMRDGSAEVAETTTHPDPWAAAILFQVREAGVVQAAGRLRMTRRDGKLLVLATSVSVPIEVDRLVSPVELERATALAAGMVDSLAEHGVALVDPKALGVQPVRLAPVVGLAVDLLGSVGNPCKSLEDPILEFCTGFAAHEARVRAGARGPRAVAWLVSSLPPAEAFAAAKAAGWNVEATVALPVEPAVEPKVEPIVIPKEEPVMPATEEEIVYGDAHHAPDPDADPNHVVRPWWMPAADMVESGYRPVSNGRGIFRDWYYDPSRPYVPTDYGESLAVAAE